MDLHINGRHDAVDCHIHGVLCLPIAAVLSVVGQHYDALVVADHFHWHETVVDAMCWRCAARHQCNCVTVTAVTTLLIIKLISVTFRTSFTVDYLRLRRRRCLSRDA